MNFIGSPTQQDLEEYRDELDKCLANKEFTDGHVVIYELVPYYLYLIIGKVVFAKRYFNILKDLCIKYFSKDKEEQLSILCALCLILGMNFNFSTFMNNIYLENTILNQSNLEAFISHINSIFGHEHFKNRIAYFRNIIKNYKWLKIVIIVI